MKLKYYLRGLGVGIIVAALVMGVSANGKTESLTDEQIIARAKELGMVDGVLSELPETDEETESTEDTEDADNDEAPDQTWAEPGAGAEGAAGEEDVSVQEAESAMEPQPVNIKDADIDLEPSEAEEGGEEAGEAGTPESGEASDSPDTVSDVKIYTVSVYPGEGSYTVSRKIAALGLVESANFFDTFLCQNGYDKKLCTGNYRIQEGASAEEIAKVLTGQMSYETDR